MLGLIAGYVHVRDIAYSYELGPVGYNPFYARYHVYNSDPSSSTLKSSVCNLPSPIRLKGPHSRIRHRNYRILPQNAVNKINLDKNKQKFIRRNRYV